MNKSILFCTLLLLCGVPRVASYGQHPEGTPVDSLSLKIGQMILVGVSGTGVSAGSPVMGEIRSGKVGGIILFEKSITPTQSAANLQKLIGDLQSAAAIPLFVSIDQEGGKVNRLKTKYGFPATRSAAYLGGLDNLDSTRFYADQTARTLADLGFNLNFAPVVDVTMPTNPVLGSRERCFSADPAVIARHALQVVRSHQAFGVHTVLKHFPGHGNSRTDSHLGVTDVTRYWVREELLPYQSIIDSGACHAVMTAHIVNQQLDPDKLPATLSGRMINDLLRNELRFDGVIFSDDMQMHAIGKQYGLEKSVKLAILAGVDVLIFSNNIAGSSKRAVDEVHAIIRKLVDAGEISPERINQSYQRIMRLKTTQYR